MRDVEFGWLIRYMHSTGASFFFVVIYMHMFRGLMYGSYQKPRELIWIFGMFIYVALMAEAFMGYVLPWGQMSYWGAQVIISLFGAIPVVGDDLVTWIKGDFLISGITLKPILCFTCYCLAIGDCGTWCSCTLWHLHEVGSNNPDGVDIKKYKDEEGRPLDGVPFHPYYTVHDLVGIVVFLFVFCFVIFFWPEGNGYFLEHANFEEANGLKTPAHIAPVWYFGAFYTILRVVPDKLFGVILMAAAIAILFVLPWLDRSPVKSWRYKGWISRINLVLFGLFFILLTWLGTQPATGVYAMLGLIGTIVYFAWFLTLPIISAKEKTKPVPERVTG